MKDILKFMRATLLMLITLTLVGVVFIQSFMGDYEWVNATLTAVYSLIVVAAAVYDGLQRGTQDCKYAALMERQATERGYVATDDERARLFHPEKGFLAGLLAASPGVILSLVAICCGPTPPLGVTFATRIALGAFLGVFQYVGALLPWLYLPIALIYPVGVGVGYLFGPKMWDKQVKLMEKAKKAKRRHVNRRRKVKKTV